MREQLKTISVDDVFGAPEIEGGPEEGGEVGSQHQPGEQGGRLAEEAVLVSSKHQGEAAGRKL